MSFKDIKGQERPINILQAYIQEGRLQGGYLFLGPEGIGKKLVARTLAKALNCLEESLDSCDKCASCIKIEKLRHPDVYLIDHNFPVDPDLEDSGDKAADSTVIRIKHIRQLQREINLRPYEGKKKVFIIDNAHKLNADASNCFLKILEEPPGDSVIILVTDKPALLFKTVISRCKVLRFSALGREEVKDIFRKEYGLENNLAHFLAYFCEGRIGSALNLKDADLLQQKNMLIDRFILSRRPEIENLAKQKREELRRQLNICVSWFRDIYMLKVGMREQELTHLDRREVLLKEAKRYNFSELNARFTAICDSILYLERNINIKLLLHNLGAQLWKE